MVDEVVHEALHQDRAAMSLLGQDDQEGDDTHSKPITCVSTAELKEETEKTFVYDEPKPYLHRLFQLDLPEDDGAAADDALLSGRLMSLTFDQDTTEVFQTFASSLREDRRKVMKELSGTERYIAISYSWGRSLDRWPLYLRTVSCILGKDNKVVVDHEPERHGYVWITPSARLFLLELRRQRERRFMWIDAVCIDQSSGEDKSNQIPRMRQVYANAEMVYVWLGEADVSEEMALRMIRNVTVKLRACQAGSHDSLEEAFDRAELPGPQHEIWKAYAAILTRDWWSRLW